MKSNRRQGFTLLELLVVVIVIGILASVALPQFGKMIRRSRVSEAETIIGSMLTANLVYYQEKGIFTPVKTELLVDVPADGAANSNYNYTLTVPDATRAQVVAAGSKTASSGITVTGTIANDGTRTITNNL